MSTDVCVNNTKKKCHSSIFLTKARLQQAKLDNSTVSPSSDSNKNNSRIQLSSSFSKLQSVGLTLLASVSKRKARIDKTISTAISESAKVDEICNSKTVTQVNRQVETAPRAIKLKTPSNFEPSCSARPFSQFFYSIQEEEGSDEIVVDVDLPTELFVAQQPTLFMPKMEPSQQRKQQQTKKPSQRHSIALDFINNHQREIPVNLSQNNINNLSPDISMMTPSISSTRNSSRSSSLKTIGSAYMAEEQAPARDINYSEAEEAADMDKDLEEEYHPTPSFPSIQSDITFLTSTFEPPYTKSSVPATNSKRPRTGLSRSISQQIKEKRLSDVVNVSRARTAFGFGTAKTKESQAILVWRKTKSQLLLDTLDEEGQHNDDVTTLTAANHIENNSKQELHEILSHPVLTPNYTLERQRFVRHSDKMPTTTMSKNLTMIKFVLNEMLETEKSYNQLLVLIRNKYMRPMIAASQITDPLVKSSDIPVLFNHLPELIRVSDRLIYDLQMTNNVGYTFCSLDSVVFLKYAMHYRSNIKTIRKACNNVLFLKIDRENLSRRDTNRMGMSDYLIAPIQRIPRYCLLLKDLQKYTPRSDPNYPDLVLALKILKSLAVAMDYAQDNKPSAAASRPSNRTL